MTADGIGVAGDYGSLATYADAAHYDRRYRLRKQDVAWYVARAAALGGPILECGVGSGRIALALARAGHDVVGVDLSAPMLTRLTQRLQQESATIRARLQVHRVDMRHLRLGRRFPLVIAPFNALLHLYTAEELRELLATVADHLAPGGRFVFDVSVPLAENLARDPLRWYRSRPVRLDGVEGPVGYRERFEYDPMRQLLVVWGEFTPAHGEPWVVPLVHRQWFPLELREVLHGAGYEVLGWTGDFSDQAPDAYTDSLVVECRPRGAAP